MSSINNESNVSTNSSDSTVSEELMIDKLKTQYKDFAILRKQRKKMDIIKGFIGENIDWSIQWSKKCIENEDKFPDEYVFEDIMSGVQHRVTKITVIRHLQTFVDGLTRSVDRGIQIGLLNAITCQHRFTPESIQNLCSMKTAFTAIATNAVFRIQSCLNLLNPESQERQLLMDLMTCYETFSRNVFNYPLEIHIQSSPETDTDDSAQESLKEDDPLVQ